MFDQTAKKKFVAIGAASGRAIEDVITAFYTQLSDRWRDAIAFDGGAHVGHHTFLLAELPRVQRVVAVEANDETFRHLQNGVAKSPFGSKVHAVQGALQDDPAKPHVYFRKSTSHPGRSGINPILQNNRETTFSEPVAVPATTIDKLLEPLSGRCEFIKLDLEGGEYFALRGASTCLRRDRPVVFFENGSLAPDLNNYRLDDFVAYLDNLGYSFLTVFCEPMSRATSADFWYAWATPKETQAENVAMVTSLMNAAIAKG